MTATNTLSQHIQEMLELLEQHGDLPLVRVGDFNNEVYADGGPEILLGTCVQNFPFRRFQPIYDSAELNEGVELVLGVTVD